jgi:hypothetical protein
VYISDVPTDEWLAGMDRPRQTRVRRWWKATEHAEPILVSSDSSTEEGENPEPRLTRHEIGKRPALEGPS